MDKVTVQECRYCDSTLRHNMYDVTCCMGCGAEWDPVDVEYDYEEVYGRENS